MTSGLWLASSCSLLLLVGCGPGELRPACLPDQVPSPQAAQAVPLAGFHAYSHAHNDYEHERPLEDALDHNFYSVEADVWFDGGKLTVSHFGFGSKGSLKDLYLDPLQALVSAHGSVHADGVPFTLWVDLKENKEGFNEALHSLLNGYPMLTVVDGDTVTPGAVTVVLTGDRTAKTAFVSDFSPRRAFRDSNDYAPDDPPADNAWRYYALDWKKYLGWNGQGGPSQEDRERLGCIVENAHADGRKVRFYAAPDREEVWSTALEFGVDFIHTDKLAELDAFLAGR